MHAPLCCKVSTGMCGAITSGSKSSNTWHCLVTQSKARQHNIASVIMYMYMYLYTHNTSIIHVIGGLIIMCTLIIFFELLCPLSPFPSFPLFTLILFLSPIHLILLLFPLDIMCVLLHSSQQSHQVQGLLPDVAIWGRHCCCSICCHKNLWMETYCYYHSEWEYFNPCKSVCTLKITVMVGSDKPVLPGQRLFRAN